MHGFEVDDTKAPLISTTHIDRTSKDAVKASMKSIGSAEQKIHIEDLLDSKKNKKVDIEEEELRLDCFPEMTQQQIIKLRSLQNPKSIYDNFGNVLDDQNQNNQQLDDRGYHTTKKMSYFISKKFPIPIQKYVLILVSILAPALFFERFFFIVAVYKARNYGYVLLLTVLFLNTLFLFLMQRLRRNKEKKSLSQVYQNEIKPQVNWIIIFIVA